MASSPWLGLPGGNAKMKTLAIAVAILLCASNAARAQLQESDRSGFVTDWANKCVSDQSDPGKLGGQFSQRELNWYCRCSGFMTFDLVKPFDGRDKRLQGLTRVVIAFNKLCS